MESTRRNFLGAVGAGALTAAAANAAETGSARSGNPKLYVAAVTPCDSKNRFDEGLYRDLMPYFKERNVDGVVVLGTTGEFASFSVAERKKVAETALKHRAGLRMIVQVGTPNLPETLELLSHSGANGADGVLCIPPFYFKNPPVEGLYKYYSQVLEATRLPVYLYHYPGMSAVPISAELLHKLEHYPNLAGIKDSTGSAEGYAIYCKEFPKLDMMTGTEGNLPAALAAGMGAISVAANLFPKQVAAVFQAHREGKDVAAAYAKFRETNSVLRVQGVPGGAAQIKFAFTGHGFRESYVRPPQLDLTAEQKALLQPKLSQLAQLG
jgi:4-hydroxy-tetrahydrodipicolinate synthase